MSQRYNIAIALRDQLTEIPELTTILVVSNIDEKYPEDLACDLLPAVKIHFTDESTEYNPDLRGLNKISGDLWLFCIEWDKNSIFYEESLLKLVRDKIGEDISIKDTAINIDIKHIVKTEARYPLVMYKINVDILYEGSIFNL
jgi:hypothetical protein